MRRMATALHARLSVRGWASFVVATAIVIFCVSLAVDPPSSVPVLRLAAALVASVVAGLAQLRLRMGSHMVAFEWGETALLLQIALLAPEWVPIATAVGFCIANVVGGRRRLALKVAYNTANWLLSATVAVIVLEWVTGGREVYSAHGLVGLAVATVSFAFTTRVFTAAVVSIAEQRSYVRVLGCGAGLAALICGGNY